VIESAPGFVTVKGWILGAAAESNMVMSVRRAKKLAGDYLTRTDPEAYLRITHSDPVGEGVARRWMDFKHNMSPVNA
jgi:HKD family nuclease